MRMVDYNSERLAGGAMVLPAPRQIAPAARESKRIPARAPASDLVKARSQVIHAQVWETAVWLTLAVAGLALLVLSFS